MRFCNRQAIVVVLILLAAPAVSAPAGDLLLRNCQIITISGDIIRDADILIRAGKIARLGRNLAYARTEVRNLQGAWVMPGIIDSHSHIAVEGNVNESGDLLTAETDVLDVLNPEDLNIFYALTGGVTTIHTMHGSANPIGGRGVVLKLRWGKSAAEMIFRGAPRTVKWALGENPKQSGFSGAGQPRYPRTRMGVEAAIRLEFERAREYIRRWQDYRQGKKNGRLASLPPRRDLGLEVVAGILSGAYWVRCHAYQSQEMLSIMRLCKEYGVKLACFEHGLEGYRITNELVQFGVADSTFADFWAFKWEAFNTMPQAAALMAQRGVLVALNSDNAERMRHLFSEAAKTLRFGGLSENEALKTITLNPARILGVERSVGTIEIGKDADLAVFNRHPLDPYAVCQLTIVDGQVYFDRAQYLGQKKQVPPAGSSQTPKANGAEV